MSSEVSFQAEYRGPSIHDYRYPLLNANTVPLSYVTDSRPSKRIRVAAAGLSSVETAQLHWEELASAQNLHDDFSTRPVTIQVEKREQQPSQSPPPQSKRGRKKKSKRNPQDGSWIQESFPFPAEQTWLKVKPRHRKAAVEVAAVKEVACPSSAAPDAGEALCLDKHADRIAALIAQKRQENESKLFRERMSLQQRLHRGEADHNDKLIAASHDELKRKMKLSAKGIFEEQAPNGKELVLQVEGRQSALSHPASRSSSVASVASSVPISPSPALLDSTEEGRTEASEAGTDGSDVDAELPRHRLVGTDEPEQVKSSEPFIPRASQQSATMVASSMYTPYEQAAYSQTQTTVTTQTFAFSNAPVESHTTQFFLMQPRFTNQRYYNQHLLQSQPEQGPVLQPWTSQMFQALPSTTTPALNSREVPTTTHHLTVEEQHNDVFDPFGSSSNTDAYACARSSVPLSDDASSTEQPQPAVLKANVNIFTRQARENGIIGGNNNYFDPAGEGGRRRNMFHNRA